MILKKWLSILSIVFIISFIGSAILAGKVYYTEIQTYTQQKKYDIDREAIKYIYINSEVAVNIQSTSKAPYAEFEQVFTDIIGNVPEYAVEIRSEGENTYIDVVQTKGINVWFGVQENYAYINLYLPQQDIESLKLETSSYWDMTRYRNSEINLEGINVANLQLKTQNSEVTLDGNYKVVDVEMNTGRLQMQSNIEANLSVSGLVVQELKGKYKEIKLTNLSGEAFIETENEAVVYLEGCGAYIKLRGKYKDIVVKGDSNTLDIESDTICKFNAEDYGSDYTLNGAFSYIQIVSQDSDIDIKTTVIPKQIKISGGQEDSITLTVPSNIPGFSAIYLGDYNLEGLDNEGEYAMLVPESDFTLTKSILENGKFAYDYGDGSIPIYFNIDVNCPIAIYDGGYNS